MKLTRLIWHSYRIVVGMGTDERNLEYGGKMNVMGSLYIASVLTCGVWLRDTWKSCSEEVAGILFHSKQLNIGEL